MTPQLFGIEHILYIIITAPVAAVGLLLCKKYATTERSQAIVLRVMAALLFAELVKRKKAVTTP